MQNIKYIKRTGIKWKLLHTKKQAFYKVMNILQYKSVLGAL